MGQSFTPELIRLLKAAGCVFVRHGKGDHDGALCCSPTGAKMSSVIGSTGSFAVMVPTAIGGDNQFETRSGSGSNSEPVAVVGSGAGSAAQYQDAVDQANNTLAQNGYQMQFVLDKTINRVIVKVIDTRTNEVLKQVPAESMLATARALAEPSAAGALVDSQA
jgi:uncharacterized FlaG/YvyC family protein